MPRAPHSSALLAGSARAKRLGVLDQRIAHPVDAAQERDVDAVDPQDRGERAAVGAPDERLRSVEIGRGRRGGRQRSSASAMRARRSAWLCSGGKARILMEVAGRFATFAAEAPDFKPERFGKMRLIQHYGTVMIILAAMNPDCFRNI